MNRDFTAAAVNQPSWVGDITEIPTAAGKLYLATVIDLYSRRLLGAATSLHPDAELAKAAITMAVAVRGGKDAIWRRRNQSGSSSTLTVRLLPA
jgi:putative transposase